MELKKINKLSISTSNQNYGHDVRVFNRWLGNRPINQKTISDFFDERALTCKPATIRRNKASIKSALRSKIGKDVSLRQMIEFKEFFAGIKINKIDQAVTEEKFLDRTERAELLKVCGYKTGLIVQALFQTASRISELLNVKLSDCEQGKKEIIVHIERQKTRTTGIVYLEKNLFREIKLAYKGDTYLFENGKGKPVSRFTVYGMIRNAGKKIRKSVHPHSLRHSWASEAIQILPLQKVSKYLGHSRLETTTRFYLHGNPSEEEVTSFNALYFK